jgi:hypothetical protein
MVPERISHVMRQENHRTTAKLFELHDYQLTLP